MAGLKIYPAIIIWGISLVSIINYQVREHAETDGETSKQ